MAADIGKVFEGQLQIVLKALKTSHLVQHERFADTGAAGSVIAAQPSDYLLGFPPGSVLLNGQRAALVEVKASEVHERPGKAMIRASQRSAINRFRLLLGIPYYILFWDAQRGVIQLWDGIAVEDPRLNPKHMLARWENCGVINRLRHDVVAQRLVEHFQIPPAAVTLQKVR